jgi:hypothetical protein
MSVQSDKELSEARALKARFDRGERDFRFSVPVLIASALCFILLTMDPFGWFSGPPATGPARQQIRMACFIIALWFPFAWFLLVRPLQTGIVVDYRKAVGQTKAVLRADEPSRFWFVYSWGALLLAGMLTFGVWCLLDGLGNLRKLRPPPNPSLHWTPERQSVCVSDAMVRRQ